MATRTVESRTPMSDNSGSSTVEAWNAAHPVGTPVTYWPGFREGEGRRGRTRTEAFTTAGKDAEPVVFIEGMAGWVALTHVEPWRFTTACGCDRYPCDCTGCDCDGTFHNPGPHCPGQEG
jgi:hypothetical protein